MEKGEPATPGKVPGEARFVDLSDYARPLAVAIARRLRDTRVRAPDVTLAFGLVGLGGAYLYASGGYPAALAGAAALQLKNVLDAVDGSLARLQNRPSRIGRFLDSITDAIVALALYAALGYALSRGRPAAYAAALAAAGLLLGLLQGTVFNHYYVRYRSRRGGDTTSRTTERVTEADAAYHRDRPFVLGFLRALVGLYRVIYGWQDALIRRLDAWAAKPLAEVGRQAEAGALRDDSRFLTAVSALGPGLQILLLDLFTVAGFERLDLALELFMWTIAGGGTLYAALILLGLRRAAVRRAARHRTDGLDG